MNDLLSTEKALLTTLSNLARGCDDDGTGSDELRQAFLDYGSETPDNKAAVAGIEVGTVNDETGLKLSGKKLLLSEIAHRLEASKLPQALKEELPQMTEDDWDSFSRITTLIYSLLDRKSQSAK